MPVRSAGRARPEWLSVAIDEQKNVQFEHRIDSAFSTVEIRAIPTNEELVVAQRRRAIVIPANVAIQGEITFGGRWIPAFAGMTRGVGGASNLSNIGSTREETALA